MIKYQEKLQDFYKMRDTLITEGYKDIESLKTYDKVELREIALEIIKDKRVNVFWLMECISCYHENTLKRYNEDILCKDIDCLTQEEYELLRKVLL